MFETVRHIEFLLSEHDCVCVPGLGAFVMQYIPASVNSTTGVILPPRRVVSFNPDLNYNDGLLPASIARYGNISYDDAKVRLCTDIAAIKLQLQLTGDVNLGNLGTLTRHRNGTVVFNPGMKFAANPALSLLSETHLPNTGIDNTLQIVRRRSTDSMAFRIVSAAASVLLVLMLVVGFSNNAVTDRALQASLSLFSPTVPIDTIDFNPPVDLTIATPDEATSMCEICKTIDYADMNYVVVVSSLATHQQAEEFISTYSNDDVPMYVIDGAHRIRVVVDGGQNLDELTQRLDKWHEHFPQAWIYRQK